MQYSPRFSVAILLGAFCCPTLYAQSQATPMFVQDVCLKAKQENRAQLRSFAQNVMAKLGKVRVDSGLLQFYVIAEAVSPMGRAAHCDIRIFSGSSGFPPEGGQQRLQAELKQAGLSEMSPDQLGVRSREVASLVGIDTWRNRVMVGNAVRGGYARFTFFKVNGGSMGEWIEAMEKGWKPLAEEFLKGGAGNGWRASTLAMPGGADLHYNAMTVDLFPNWAAFGAGNQARTAWKKVHPNADMSAYMSRVATYASRPRVDVMRILEVITK